MFVYQKRKIQIGQQTNIFSLGNQFRSLRICEYFGLIIKRRTEILHKTTISALAKLINLQLFIKDKVANKKNIIS